MCTFIFQVQDAKPQNDGMGSDVTGEERVEGADDDEAAEPNEDDEADDNDDDNASNISGFSGLSGDDWKPTAGPMAWIQRQALLGTINRTPKFLPLPITRVILLVPLSLLVF